MSYRVSTQGYSGPFDLLLQLVSRQKVDIGSISIAEVAEQYLAEVERLEALDLDVASDFLLVAATLLDIKTFLLEAEHVAPHRIPIELTVASVDRVTISHPHTTFRELLDGDATTEQVVATFLAILELAKRGSLVLEQDENFGTIRIDRVEGAPEYHPSDGSLFDEED